MKDSPTSDISIGINASSSLPVLQLNKASLPAEQENPNQQVPKSQIISSLHPIKSNVFASVNLIIHKKAMLELLILAIISLREVFTSSETSVCSYNLHL